MVAGLAIDLRDLFGLDPAAKVELEDNRAEAAAAAPRLDASYAFLDQGLAGIGSAEGQKSTSVLPREAGTILSYPPLQNEILRELDELARDHLSKDRCSLNEPVYSVAFLVVRNRGRRDATDVSVTLQRLRLRGPVRVSEGQGDDYEAKLRAAGSSAPITMRIPLTLGPGEGVRVPLWLSVARYKRSDVWCVVSNSALLPESLSFVDGALGAGGTSTDVRRMADPVMLANGIVGRG